MDLDSLKEISKIDKENMLDLLVSFPKQCEDALFIGEHSEMKTSYKKAYRNVVFAGVGGSAIGADIVKGQVEDELDIPLVVNRDYTLPAFVDKNSLVFAVSYSGNTEETLSAYAKAKNVGADVVVITSGGKLKELALRNRDALIMIPKGYPPRCALGYSVIPAIVALSKLGLIKERRDEIKKAASLLSSLEREKLSPGVKVRVNISKRIAKRLLRKIPAIYASRRLESIATRWRGQFAENSKTLSSMHVFPEMNHNEIVGWVNPRVLLKSFVAVILRDSADSARVKKRMDVTKTILRKEKFRVLEIESQGKSFLERALSLAYIGDFASFYLAILNEVDPTPVDRVVYLKKELAK